MNTKTNRPICQKKRPFVNTQIFHNHFDIIHLHNYTIKSTTIGISILLINTYILFFDCNTIEIDTLYFFSLSLSFNFITFQFPKIANLSLITINRRIVSRLHEKMPFEKVSKWKITFHCWALALREIFDIKRLKGHTLRFFSAQFPIH